MARDREFKNNELSSPQRINLRRHSFIVGHKFLNYDRIYDRHENKYVL